MSCAAGERSLGPQCARPCLVYSANASHFARWCGAGARRGDGGGGALWVQAIRCYGDLMMFVVVAAAARCCCDLMMYVAVADCMLLRRGCAACAHSLAE